MRALKTATEFTRMRFVELPNHKRRLREGKGKESDTRRRGNVLRDVFPPRKSHAPLAVHNCLNRRAVNVAAPLRRASGATLELSRRYFCDACAQNFMLHRGLCAVSLRLMALCIIEVLVRWNHDNTGKKI